MPFIVAKEVVAESDEDIFQNALIALASFLKTRDYRFVTTTPATHTRILERSRTHHASDLRGIFGWSMTFGRGLIDAALFHQLKSAGVVQQTDQGFKSTVRASSLGEYLFFHSAYPTDGKDAVFFGPDSYRFARLIEQELARCPQLERARLVDVGTGAGVGAIVAAQLCPLVDIMMTDINAAALRFAEVNARIAGVSATTYLGNDLSGVEGEFDIVLANPPYLIDDGGRAYRDGGGMHGAEVSLKMAEDAVSRLAPGGRFILYTGSAIVAGEDALRASLTDLACGAGCAMRYEEIDPDVFGEELANPAYRDVDRIAVVSAVIERLEGRP